MAAATDAATATAVAAAAAITFIKSNRVYSWLKDVIVGFCLSVTTCSDLLPGPS